jgi:hypothetical protein
MEIMAASKLLKDDNLKQLIAQFDNYTLIPIDSYTLTEILHINGINIKYLGEITKLSKSPHI